MSLFRWGTIKETGTQYIQHQGVSYPGKVLEVGIVSGSVILAWRADDLQQYFCHGLTFGGKAALGGPISPFTGWSVEAILADCFFRITDEADAQTGDILVWIGLAPESTPHSAILTTTAVDPGLDYLDEHTTTLQSKNGLNPNSVRHICCWAHRN